MHLTGLSWFFVSCELSHSILTIRTLWGVRGRRVALPVSAFTSPPVRLRVLAEVRRILYPSSLAIMGVPSYDHLRGCALISRGRFTSGIGRACAGFCLKTCGAPPCNALPVNTDQEQGRPSGYACYTGSGPSDGFQSGSSPQLLAGAGSRYMLS